jgi:type II secretion system protein H
LKTTARPTDAFTLIELILVLALLVVITSLAIPPMARFIRGRALDSETQRFVALAHAAQSRAVSEGMPMLLWVNAEGGSYGVTAETTGKEGDAKAETLMLDSTLHLVVSRTSAAAPVQWKNLPAIRFLPDGTVDEDSALKVQLSDADGFQRLLVESENHTGYDVSD